MTRTSVYPAWSGGHLEVSTAEDVAGAWRNMISKSLEIKLMKHADLPKPLPMDPQLCWGKQPKALPSVHNSTGGWHVFFHSPCSIP